MPKMNPAENPDAVLTMEEWEPILGVAFLEFDPKKELKRSDINDTMYHGLDWTFRKEWLETNGYELTRENFIDASLPTVNPPAPEESI